jgi:hypothetical protein
VSQISAPARNGKVFGRIPVQEKNQNKKENKTEKQKNNKKKNGNYRARPHIPKPPMKKAAGRDSGPRARGFLVGSPP